MIQLYTTRVTDNESLYQNILVIMTALLSSHTKHIASLNSKLYVAVKLFVLVIQYNANVWQRKTLANLQPKTFRR